MDGWRYWNGRIKWGGKREMRERMWRETAKIKGNLRAVLKPNTVEAP